MSQEFAFPALEGAVVAPGARAPVRADEIVARARAEAAQIAAAAEAEGRERGLAEGLADARAQLEPTRAALEQAIGNVAAAHAELAAALERRAVELAVRLAGKILAAALELEPARVGDVVAGALRRTASRDRLVVEVNADDHALVSSVVDDVARSLGVRQLEVRAERRVGRGGCVVRTEEGEVDARLEEQLEKAREILLDAARGA